MVAEEEEPGRTLNTASRYAQQSDNNFRSTVEVERNIYLAKEPLAFSGRTSTGPPQHIIT